MEHEAELGPWAAGSLTTSRRMPCRPAAAGCSRLTLGLERGDFRQPKEVGGLHQKIER